MTTTNLAEIKQYSYHGDTNQRFKLVDRGNGYYSIHPICSGLGLDAYNAGTEVGTKVIQYAYHGGNNMLWGFEHAGYIPKGSVDHCVAGEGYIDIAGWAYDQDNPGETLTIHVYASGEMIASFAANTYRPDIENAFPGAGNYHGFSQRIYTNKTGEQTITAYALNIGAGYSNPAIGSNVVNLLADTTKPVVTSAHTSQCDRDGFSVVANASDNTGVYEVQVAVLYDGQAADEAKWYKGSLNADGTYSCSVNVSDFDNYEGTYYIYVYALDWASNVSEVYRLTEKIDRTAPIISEVTITDVNGSGFTVNCIAEDNVAIDRVQFPTWTEYNGQDDLASEWWINPSVTGEKNSNRYSFRVKDSEHNYERGSYGVHIYAYDTYGNYKIYQTDYTFENLGEPVAETTLDGHTYQIIDDKVTWSEAKKLCENLGGHLVTITSEEEQNAIMDILPDNTVSTCESYFIGGFTEDGISKWITGEAFEYSNWYPGEPNNSYGIENVYQLYRNSGEWNDVADVKDNMGYICEFEPQVELETITLDKEDIELHMGDTAQLTVIYEPENAVVESDAEWTSDNADVATVEKGMITAVGVGTATITATVDGKQASCIVTVNPEAVEIEDIVLTPAEVDLYVGQMKTITVSILPEGLQPNESIQWLDYDENTISVKAKNSESLAEVKGLKAGTTQIKVRVDGIEKTVVVTVLPCTIRLDYRDGSEIRSIDAVYGEPISNLPSNPEREGYIFAGWYTKENGEGELVTADTILIDQWILYAHWISVNDGMWAIPIGDQVYTGKAIKPSVEVYDGDTLLVLGQDYTVSYKNNTKVADKNAAKAPTVVVKGKGQYQSSATVTFNIVPKSIEDMDVTAESVYKTVSSKVQKPTPVVKWANKSLKKGKDFTVSYPETQSGAYKEPGRYEIVIKGTGNYTGERSVWLVLSEKERTPIGKASVKKIADVQWEGYEICPKPVVTYKKATLEEGIDYELDYENNIEVGTATIKIIGIGSYSGMKKVTFKIKGVSISKASVNGLGPVTYNGENQEPLTTLWVDGKELVEDDNYTVAYKNNRNVGTAQVIFTGKGKYTGTLKKTFRINQYDFSAHSLDYIDRECFYSKGGSKPAVSLWVNGENLVEGKDYRISYKNNKAVNDGSNLDKLPTVIITGKGNYKGTIKDTFKIEAKYINDVSINVQDVVTPTKKNKWKSIPVLTDTDGKKLVAGKDYDKNIVYTYAEEAIMQDGSIREAGTEVDKNDIPSVGTFIDVTINGINNYHGTAIVTYMVVPASIAKAKTSVPNQIYTGQEITLEESDITVKVGGQKLSTDDFEIVPDSYVNNVKKGTASVTIRGTGNYGGTKVVKFKIVPKSIIWWR